MADWVWVAQSVVLAVHDEQIAEHGGAAGVRDLGLLESALARPQHLAVYDPDADAAGLAAAYAFGIARNYPFVDGNKRTALVALELFLELNEYRLVADDADCVATILALAGSEMTESELTVWVRERMISAA